MPNYGGMQLRDSDAIFSRPSPLPQYAVGCWSVDRRSDTFGDCGLYSEARQTDYIGNDARARVYLQCLDATKLSTMVMVAVIDRQQRTPGVVAGVCY